MPSIRRTIVFAGIVVLVVVAAARFFPASVASPTGIVGTVTDLATKRPLPGVRLRAGALEAVTDASGHYRLPVEAGLHAVRAEASGYVGMTRRYLTVADGRETGLDLAMVTENASPEEAAAIEAAFLRSAEEAAARQAETALAGELAVQNLAATGITEAPATIRVLMPDGTVVEMGLDEYLKGVVPNEMPPNWPAEALRAQAVAARSYAITGAGHADVGADVCTTTHCQVWTPTQYDSTDRAVDETHGVTARYQGNVIRAFFHAHCDGQTRSTQDAWGSTVPYCQGVVCPCGYSSLYGHGVGMCQYGARALALEGFGYVDILKHYFAGIEVVGPPSPVLAEPALTPASGDQSTRFAFEIAYLSANGAPPAVANVIIDGHAHTLTLSPTQPEEGRRYRLEASLPAGEHEHHYYFDDGTGNAVRVPPSGAFAGPAVSPSGTPLAPAAEDGTVARYLTFSTPNDWTGGEHQGTWISGQGDGAVALAEGATTGTYTSPVLSTPLTYVALGAGWHSPCPGGAQVRIEVRTSSDGAAWGPWQVVEEDNEPDEGGAIHSALLFGEGRALQYRVTLTAGPSGARPTLQDLHFVCIDSRDGPQAADGVSSTALAAASDTASGMPQIITRQGWGANEALMTAEPDYRPVTAVVVHHTATDDGGVDPAAMVRAIYYYHAVSREWGDIGYNFLIDKYGNIYEGRSGGSGVVGFHAAAYNWGSVGISLIGNYQSVDVSAPMRDALTWLLAAKASEHWIDPLAEQHFIDRVLPTIMGHRDVGTTACPGARAYALLPDIRSAVAALLSSQPPQVRITAPGQNAAVRGVLEITASCSVPVGEATLLIDGAEYGSQAGGTYSWRWNTATVPEGRHLLRVSVRNPGGVSAADAAVWVDNTPPTGSVTVPAWHNSASVPLTLQGTDATAVQFSNGWIWEGEDLVHQEGTGRRVDDPEAVNGAAWQGTTGDAAGWWHGPYTLDLPTWQEYQVHFRLKSPQNSGTTPLAFLDIVDNLSTRTYDTRTVTGQDLATSGYEEFALDLVYQSTSPTYNGEQNGLEFRTWFQAHAELYLDRVSVFTKPQDLSAAAWQLEASEGEYTGVARLLDEAGNALDLPVTTRLDLAAPEAVGEAADGATRVLDTLSGLDTSSAAWSASENGGRTWSTWQTLPVTPTLQPGATVGILDEVLLQAPEEAGELVRLRIRDMAGNWLVMPPYTLGLPLVVRGSGD